ncbi:Isopenicillin N epimerase [Planctomycetes bacterium CA13]|uniref:Isopenicillin N epimerase n=1 Tax=Novipirellula herctigrandis TaxID=2527986 RepID=A0A5C5ZBH9_9BACT|nr:Isopenicillin N epimerase [Planctomycetes bacterium CA13]
MADLLTKRSPFANHWGLNPNIDFLNHGSFGATPKVVLETQRDWILRQEHDPIEFLAPERSLLPKLDYVRSVVANFVQGDARSIALVRNSTEGVNAVLRSFPLASGDEVVITNHGYNACNNAVRFATERVGATVVQAKVPFPLQSPDDVIDAIDASFTPKTRLLLVDHVTSPTGLVFPVERIVSRARDRGIRVMVDGSHAPGMLPVDLNRIDADYYTANHHKWLCGPKSSGFLFVRSDLQSEVRPTSISHGANLDGFGDSKFLGEFNWTGTFDPSPILALPAAIHFLSELFDDGIGPLLKANHQLALAGRRILLERFGVESASPESMIGSLATIPIPVTKRLHPADMASIQRELYQTHRIEVPVFLFQEDLPCVRISAQVYNHIEQYQRLADVIIETVEAVCAA